MVKIGPERAHVVALISIVRFHLEPSVCGIPKLIELAALLGRKVGSVSNKLANFSRHDPTLQERKIKGLSHGAKGEAAIWAEFASQPENLAFESERLLAEKLRQSIEKVAQVDEMEFQAEGREREAILRVRVNQNFFRKRVLSAYDYKCCITGLGVRDLLVASHIVPWAEVQANGLNPKNGLCLNAFHDRAFDRHLISVDSNFCVRFIEKVNF